MSRREDSLLLSDIHQAIHRIESYLKDVDYDIFLQDHKTQDAVIRNIEILGEATKNISNEFREKYSEIPWSSMAKMRDRLIHHYFGVNLDVVWQVITVDLPRLKPKFAKILEDILRAIHF